MNTVPPHTPQDKPLPEFTFIYRLRDPETKEIRYVGKSDNPQQRLRQHLSESGKCYRVRWMKSLTSGGLAPELEIIEEVPYEQWEERERYWIAFYRAQGYNLTNGADGGEGAVGLVHTDETRRQMSQSHKASEVAKAHLRDISKSNKGRVQSEEIVQKRVEANKRHYQSEESQETRRKISEANKGRVRSEETRQRIREAKIGIPCSEEHKRKNRETQKGRPISEEHHQKLIDAGKKRRGIPLSEETKRKSSETKKSQAFHLSEETKRKMSAATRGKKHSEEHNRHVSEALKGRVFSEAHRQNMSASAKRRGVSPEHIAHMHAIKAQKRSMHHVEEGKERDDKS